MIFFKYRKKCVVIYSRKNRDPSPPVVAAPSKPVPNYVSLLIL